MCNRISDFVYVSYCGQLRKSHATFEPCLSSHPIRQIEICILLTKTYFFHVTVVSWQNIRFQIQYALHKFGYKWLPLKNINEPISCHCCSFSQNIHMNLAITHGLRKSKSEIDHSQLLKLDTIIMFKVHSTCITRSFELPKQNSQPKSYFFGKIARLPLFWSPTTYLPLIF